MVQVVGAIAGALLQAALDPAAQIWKTSSACIQPSPDLSRSGLFGRSPAPAALPLLLPRTLSPPHAPLISVLLAGWEMILTFLFVLVCYAAQLVFPGHGDAAPIATGVTLFGILSSGEVTEGPLCDGFQVSPLVPPVQALNTQPLPVCMHAAGKLTGGSPVNPARTIASSFIFNCFWNSEFRLEGLRSGGRMVEGEGLRSASLCRQPTDCPETHPLSFPSMPHPWPAATWIYLGAQLVGCFLAAAAALSFHGKGPFYTTFSGSTETRQAEALLSGDIAAEPEGPPHEQRLTFAPTGRP